MADIITAKQRSLLMARIRGSRNESTELLLARMLRAQKINGWRRHMPLPGRPDFAYRIEKVAIFVDGCFWHGCSIHFNAPKTRAVFWRRKIAGNKQRDVKVTKKLRAMGWIVLRIWEHELENNKAGRTIERIRRAIESRRES